MNSLKVKKTNLLCGTVLFSQLLWMQTKVFYPGLNGIPYQILYYMKYFGASILVVYTLSRPRELIYRQRKNQYLNTFVPLFILFAVIETFAIVKSPVIYSYGISYWTRFIAYLLDKICIFTEISCIFILCKKNAIKCVTTAMIVNGLLIIGVSTLRTGILKTLEALFQVFGFNTSSSLMEVHELTYCMALLIIYYLFFENVKMKKDCWKLLWLIIIFWVGNKRIAFAGILLATGFAIFVFKKGLGKRTLIFVGAIGVIVCILYVSILYNGEFLAIMTGYNINVMGRDAIYLYFINRTDFSVTYLGWGFASVSKTIENMTKAEVGNMYVVRGLHNDILKMYIECGFVGAIVWYMFQLILIPVNIFKRLGKQEATLFMTLSIFAFVTYLTDNTENYFVFQVLLFLIPLAATEQEF